MKEQQLKELFKLWEHKQKLPSLRQDHSSEFRTRLNHKKNLGFKKKFFLWAAIALICFGLGSAFQYTQVQTTEEIQFQKVEMHLMQLIDEQMNTIENSNSPAVQKTLERIKSQLQSIQNDYHRIYNQWEANPKQTKLIHALISNLNTQINLLTKINTTLTTIQKTTYEDSTI